jgi:hypothetical protein
LEGRKVFFTAEEVNLIRKAADTMPLGGARDSGKAQLSSLTDYATSSTLDALLMDIEAREKARKIPPVAAAALAALLKAAGLTDEERERLRDPGDPHERERALRHKRAMALRYVNRLRAERPGQPGHEGRQGGFRETRRRP